MKTFETIDNLKRAYLIYTLQCDLKCTHCLVNSSPKRSEKMSLDFVYKTLDALRGVGVEIVYISGGEVFLFYDELKKIVLHTHNLGLLPLVETNGAWAVDEKITFERLSVLKELGLHCIATSIDTFHFRQDPQIISKIKTIARISQKLNLHNRIMMITSEEADIDATIEQELQEANIAFTKEGLMLLGRATRVSQSSSDIDLANYCCDSIGYQIMPNGDIYSCCGVAGGPNDRMKKTPLFHGNATVETLDAVLRKRNHTIVACIDKQTHRRIIEILQVHNLSVDCQSEGVRSLCDYCYRVFSNPERVNVITSALLHE